jgi:F-type H+-transporting ATPase subunit a
MIVLVATILLVLTLTRRMRLVPHGKQNFAEIVVEMLYGIPEQVMGPRGRAYAPFLGTFFIYIFLMNLSGLIPFFKPGTASLSVTLGLGITAFIAVQYFGFKTHGAGYIKHFMGPVLWLSWLILPLELISELIRPMSLSIRLYGNIFGEEQIVSALANNIPVIGPLAAVLILPLQLLTVVLQALVFTLLVTVYIALATEKHEEHHVTEEVAGMPAPALEH